MKIRHILKSAEFKKLIKKASKIQGETMTLYLSQEPGSKQGYVGLIVSKKIVPLAVKRNLIRRLIYGYFQNSGKKEELKQAFKVIVKLERIRKDNKKFLSQTIREDLGKLMNKAGLIA